MNNPFKYEDGYLDASGLYKFGTRYYDPNLGRWTQQDPVAGSLVNANGLNHYTFAGDDPVNQVDPSGKASVSGSWSFFAWTLYLIGNAVRLWVNSALASAITIVGGIVFAGIGAIVGGLVGNYLGGAVASIVLGGIGGIVGGLFGSLPGLYDLYCGGTGVYFNLYPLPVTLSPAC